MRVKVSYVDGKGYTEQLISAPTVAAITLPGARQHAADHGRREPSSTASRNTTALAGQAFDYFSPFAALVAGGAEIFTDQQTAPNALTYSAVADGRLAAVQRRTWPSTSIRATGRRRVQEHARLGPDGAFRDRRRRRR